MAKGCSWSIHVEKHQLPDVSGLLLSIHGDEQTEFHNFIISDTTYQINICKTWNTVNLGLRQQTSIFSKCFYPVCNGYGVHNTSSPNYPQSNGEAERAVQTMKSILNKVKNPYLGLLSYRATPLANGYSPAELLMGRKLCSTIPMIQEMYKPKLPPHPEIFHKEQLSRSKQQKNFNKRHRAHLLKPLKTGDHVWIPEFHQQTTVLQEVAPRSYMLQTSRGKIRRNRQQLTFLNTTENTFPNQTRPVTDSVSPTSPQETHPIPSGVTITRSGHVLKPMDRLNL